MILTERILFREILEYITADIYLLPTHKNETMMNIISIKISEYMAMGKPVIASNFPGVQTEFGLNNGINYIENPVALLEKSILFKEIKGIEVEGKKSIFSCT